MINYTINTGIFSCDVKVILCSSNKELSKYFKKIKYKSPITQALTTTFYNRGPIIVFGPKTTYGAIAHECLHATNNIMRLTGAKMSDEELQAYTVQYLVDCIISNKRYSKWIEKIRNKGGKK